MSSESCADCNRDVTNSASLDICPTCYARLADAEDDAVSLRAENERLRSLALSLGGGREELPEWAKLRVDAMLAKDGGT